MMNRIDKLFNEKSTNILSVYFTAGYPNLNDTELIIKSLVKEQVDLVEIGMPFSDPLADGPVIQKSSDIALKNGITMKRLFEQLQNIRKEIQIPLIYMGYLNNILQFGPEKFCAKCNEVGIDGVILPDLPLDVFMNDYKELFKRYALHMIFLITPQTSDERIKQLDDASGGFLYMVSSSSTTGVKEKIRKEQEEYFKRVQALNLKNPVVIGFGISNHETFKRACRYANGAIIGSAFIKALEDSGNIDESIHEFISEILNK